LCRRAESIGVDAFNSFNRPVTQRQHPQVLRLGTRGSLLARTQSQSVADAVEAAHSHVRVELHVMKTSGDRITDRPLHELGGKGLFTKELEQALLAGEIDFAVHSFKDVPVTMPLVDPSRLVVAAVPRREDPRDALVSHKAARVEDLPRGARVGTGSLRRRCQVLQLRPDLAIEPVRGNIDTRLRKLRDGEFDAVVLAMAGLVRAGVYDPALIRPIDPDAVLCAAGQGALALQCRRDDSATYALLRTLNDPATEVCVRAERDVVRGLRGDCHSPIAAWARVEQGTLLLLAAVGGRDGAPPVLRAGAPGIATDPQAAVDLVLADLRGQGADALLHPST
jgi:hydroxymethylbilane synthase